jgi:ribosomal protein L40E
LICRSCGAKNPDEANFCIRCGAQLRGAASAPRKRKRRTGPLVLILLVLLLLLLGALALAGAFAVGSHHSGVIASAPSATPTIVPTPSPTPPTTFSFTDPTTGVGATVDSPRIDGSGDAGRTPSSGKEFVVVPATVHNGGAGDASYYGLDFSAYDQKDNQYRRVQETMYPRQDGKYIGFGALTKGQTHSGVVVFELPLNTPTVTIKWDDSKNINPPKTLGTFHLG